MIAVLAVAVALSSFPFHVYSASYLGIPVAASAARRRDPSSSSLATKSSSPRRLQQGQEGVNEVQWPPIDIGNNTPSMYGLAPRAFFYGACNKASSDTERWCDVFGGIGQSRQATNDMYEANQVAFPFAPNSNRHNILYLKITPPGCPTPRSGGAMVMLRSVEYNVTYGLVYGGADGDSTPLSDMHIYHYDKETWLAVTPPPDFNQLPPTLMLPAMVATGGENFTVFFGASSTLGLSRSVYEGVLDLKSMSVVSFRLINANATNPEDGLPGGRVGPCCVHYSGHPLTMCFGGVDGIDMLGDTWLYNHTNGTWTLIQPPSDAALYPSPRFAAQCDYLPQDKSALVYGGFLDGSRNPVQDSNIYAFSFETYQWSVLGDTTSVVPVRGAGAMFVTNNGKNIEIVGGQGAIDVLGDRWIMSVLSDTPSSSTTTSISAPTNVEEDDLVPEARQYHVSVQIGGGFLIAFGLGSVLYNNVYFCANLTQSGAHQCLWLEITTGASLSVPSPRYSLSGCAKGNVVYFFGGFTSVDGSLMSNELWTLTLDFTSSDVVTGVWNMITPSSSVVTPSRARHQCVMSDANMILIAGVVGAPTSLSGSVVAFNLQQQVWVTLTVSPPLLPRAAFGLHYNGTHAFLVGGISTSLRGTEVLRDIVAVWEAVEGNGNLLLSQTIVTPYPVVRADAAVAGVGNNLMVCGGSLYESSQLYLGAPIDLQCAAVAIGDTAATGVQFYPMFRTNSYSRIVEAGGIGGSGAFVGDHFVFFGGSITQDQVERQDTYYDLTESFILSSFLCTQEQIAAAGSAAYKLPCLPCGLGSRNPTAAEVAANISCVFAPPGSYVAFNGQVIIPCPAGRASNIIGAGELDACELCAEGTYAPVPFSTKCLPCPANMRCPLGCSVPLSTAGMNSTVYQSQPAVMDDGETPPLIYTGAAVIVAFLLTILAIVTYLAQSARKQRLAYFFNDGAREICRGVYESYKRSHFGLDSKRLRLALRDLGASRLPPEFVDRILAENDQSGAGHVTFSAFEEVIITFIERGLIQPFPGTGQDLNPGKALGRVKRSLSQFSFKNLDSYDTEHALGVEGEAIRIHSTLSGGVTRLLFNVLAVGAALALVGQFVYTNISEARATTPSVNYNAPLVTNSLEMKVSAIGGVLSRGDCVVVPSSSSTVNINSTSSDRPEACLFGTGIVSLSAGIYSESNFTQTCTYDAPTSACTLALTCSQCSLDFGQTVSVGVKFDPNVYAQIIEVQVSVDTGINADATSGGWSALSGEWGSSDSSSTNPNGEISQSGIIITPSLTSDVFRGYPASVMTFPILPTSFEEVGNIITQNIITSTGYHVQLGSSVSGNTIDSSQVTQYFGVPVTIEFVTDSNILTVKRLPKATVLDFLSQMLGSITGMGGILVTLMQAYDAKFISQRHEKLRAELEEQALTGEQDNRSRGRFDNEDDDDDNSDGDDDADNIQEDTALYEDSINGLSQPKKKKKRNSKQKQVDGISLRSNGNGSVVSHKSNGPASSALDQELIPVNGSC